MDNSSNKTQPQGEGGGRAGAPESAQARAADPAAVNGGQVTNSPPNSPPANVNPVETCTCQFLSSGIDSLVLAVDIIWQDETFFNYLAELKATALQLGIELPGKMATPNQNDEWNFAIQPYGSKGYEWLLIGKEFAFKIGNWLEPKSRPSAMVEIRSEVLWRIGVKQCIAALKFLLQGSGAKSILLKPSRVDLCVDLLFPAAAWDMHLTHYRVTRAQDSQAFIHQDRLTGFTIGKGKFLARIYDKAFEIDRKSKKTWMYRIWNVKEVPKDKRVIRVEFQIRREGLKELAIETFDSFMKHQANVWRYCTDNWLKFMDRPGKHQVTQREILPWWVSVQEGYQGAQDANPLVRAEAFRKDRERIFRQSQGLLTSLVALHLEDTEEANREEIDLNHLLMANFESATQGGGEESFKDRVLKKIHKYQRIQDKQETIKRLRREMNFPLGD